MKGLCSPGRILGKDMVQISARTPANITQLFHGFLQSFQTLPRCKTIRNLTESGFTVEIRSERLLKMSQNSYSDAYLIYA
jgi:hypothetical protein